MSGFARLSLIACLLLSRLAFGAPLPLSPAVQAEAVESFEYLRKLGSDALEAGDFEVARIHLQKALRLKPKDRLTRVLYAEARRALRRKAADDYVARAGKKLGWKLEGALINSSLEGAGASLAWVQPDPDRLALGLRLSGSYSDYPSYEMTHRDFSVSPSVEEYKTRSWGNQMSGRLELEWLAWHGRGRRNRFYMASALGWGFAQCYRNEVRTELKNQPGLVSATSYYIYRGGPTATLGGGLSTKYGWDFEGGISSIFGQGEHPPFISSTEVRLGMGYFF